MGLPESYSNSIEEIAGGPIMPTWIAPDVTALEKRAESSPELLEALSKAGAADFRALLGKLSWYSLTSPVLAFYVGWLGSG